MRARDLDSLGQINRKFDSHGYSFYESYNEKDTFDLGIDPSSFGMAFISPFYIERHRMNDYELLKYEPCKISNWQDYVVLRKR